MPSKKSLEKENPDFKGLEGLSPKTLERVKSARIEARSIIEYIDPKNISSFADLIKRLRESLKKAEKEQKMSKPFAFGE